MSDRPKTSAFATTSDAPQRVQSLLFAKPFETADIPSKRPAASPFKSAFPAPAAGAVESGVLDAPSNATKPLPVCSPNQGSTTGSSSAFSGTNILPKTGATFLVGSSYALNSGAAGDFSQTSLTTWGSKMATRTSGEEEASAEVYSSAVQATLPNGGALPGERSRAFTGDNARLSTAKCEQVSGFDNATETSAAAGSEESWRCKVCGKTKDLKGKHLDGKTEVRSDCWPCAKKQVFVRSGQRSAKEPQHHGAAETEISGALGEPAAHVPPTLNALVVPTPSAESLPPKNAATVTVDGIENCDVWRCKVCGKTKDLKGKHLDGKTEVRSDCWPCAKKQVFTRSSQTAILNAEVTRSLVSAISPPPDGGVTREVNSTSVVASFLFKAPHIPSEMDEKSALLTEMPTSDARRALTFSGDDEDGAWRCSVCGKVKELKGPHLDRKREVRSDCWPCAKKQTFVRCTGHADVKSDVTPAAVPPTIASAAAVAPSNASNSPFREPKIPTSEGVEERFFLKESQVLNFTESTHTAVQGATVSPTNHGTKIADKETSVWRCSVCGKVKDLHGPHLREKEVVRSDCWPCAKKQTFVLRSEACTAAQDDVKKQETSYSQVSCEIQRNHTPDVGSEVTIPASASCKSPSRSSVNGTLALAKTHDSQATNGSGAFGCLPTYTKVKTLTPSLPMTENNGVNPSLDQKSDESAHTVSFKPSAEEGTNVIAEGRSGVEPTHTEIESSAPPISKPDVLRTGKKSPQAECLDSADENAEVFPRTMHDSTADLAQLTAVAPGVQKKELESALLEMREQIVLELTDDLHKEFLTVTETFKHSMNELSDTLETERKNQENIRSTIESGQDAVIQAIASATETQRTSFEKAIGEAKQEIITQIKKDLEHDLREFRQELFSDLRAVLNDHFKRVVDREAAMSSEYFPGPTDGVCAKSTSFANHLSNALGK